MNFKFTIKHELANFEIEVANEGERKEAMKMFKYTLKDIKEGLSLVQSGTVTETNTPANNVQSVPEVANNEPEMATDGQKKYMDKLGIKYDEKTTKIEAIDLINEYKIAHGIPIGTRQDITGRRIV